MHSAVLMQARLVAAVPLVQRPPSARMAYIRAAVHSAAVYDLGCAPPIAIKDLASILCDRHHNTSPAAMHIAARGEAKYAMMIWAHVGADHQITL